ncbi:MAG: hypothetical protein J5752_11915 [Clostridiales bacterium]|nr:hypothetical protein [Clostridiales bacterium]
MSNTRAFKFTFAIFAVCLIIAAASFNIGRIIMSGIFFAAALVCAALLVFFNNRLMEAQVRKK